MMVLLEVLGQMAPARVAALAPQLTKLADAALAAHARSVQIQVWRVTVCVTTCV